MGAEYQHGFGKSYDINHIGGLYEGFGNSWKNTWQLGLSYTFDITKDEKDSHGNNGFSLSAGYRYGYNFGTSGNLITGARLAFSFLNDAKNEKHTAFSPSIEFGYHTTFNNFGKGGFATPSIGLGYDIPMNAEKSKEENKDHEGVLFNTRLAVGYRF